MDEQYQDFGKEIELIPWVDHVYASLRWTEDSVRRLHQLLEHETVDDELRGKVAVSMSWLDSARSEASHALEKMGLPGTDQEKSRRFLSAIADETKAKVLELIAVFLETMLSRPEASRSHAALVGCVREAIHEIKAQAAAIAASTKASLEGPR